jgi:hypothetical protein
MMMDVFEVTDGEKRDGSQSVLTKLCPRPPQYSLRQRKPGFIQRSGTALHLPPRTGTTVANDPISSGSNAIRVSASPHSNNSVAPFLETNTRQERARSDPFLCAARAANAQHPGGK